MIHENWSLLAHNTFGIEAKAKRFIEYESVDELKGYLRDGLVTVPFLHIGEGSNLLFTGDFQGTVLHSKIGGIEVLEESEKEVSVRVGAGVIWDDMVAHCVKMGWYGAENLSWIPGEVGASAVQNIGAYGAEVRELITAVETVDVDGQVRVFDNEACGYAYRDSVFKREEMKRVFVTHVRYRLWKEPHWKLEYGAIRQELGEEEPTLERVRKVIIRIRQCKLPDPKVMGNAGSFFMNPVVDAGVYEDLKTKFTEMPAYVLADGRVKVPAGWLIERAGWKGRALGRAAVHDKQALVLVNRGGATGKDVVALSDAVREAVKGMFGIEIHPEVNRIGD